MAKPEGIGVLTAFVAVLIILGIVALVASYLGVLPTTPY
jgi:hypothetical protein